MPDGQVDRSAARLNQENYTWRRSAPPAPRRVFERIKSEPADEVVARFNMVIGICNLHHQIRTASVPGFGGIEPASCFLDSGAVLPGPKAKTANGFEQGMS